MGSISIDRESISEGSKDDEKVRAALEILKKSNPDTYNFLADGNIPINIKKSNLNTDKNLKDRDLDVKGQTYADRGLMVNPPSPFGNNPGRLFKKEDNNLDPSSYYEITQTEAKDYIWIQSIDIFFDYIDINQIVFNRIPMYIWGIKRVWRYRIFHI